MSKLSEVFSQYTIEFQPSKLSDSDREHLVNAFVNWVGCLLGGVTTPAVDAAARAFLAMSPGGTHRALARTERFDLVHAISLDCLASAILGFDDAHLETVLHPTGPIASALLGVCRTQKVSGRDFISALHVGMEVQCRTGLAFASAGTGSKLGWYATGWAGGIGAAVAVGKLLKFNEAQLRNAMGLAASRASGNRGTHRSMAAGYVPALAAESGFIAAKLTEAGFICQDRAFDGHYGLIELLAEKPAIERALRGLGVVSEAARTGFKPYASGIVLHPVIDACLALVRDHKINPSELKRLHLSVSQATMDLTARKYPTDDLDALTSLYHWAAIALTFADIGIEYGEKKYREDSRIRALQELTLAEFDETVADDQCVAVATLSDGRQVTVKIEHALGSALNPMKGDQIDRKFIRLAQGSPLKPKAENLLRTCRNILELEDAAAIYDV